MIDLLAPDIDVSPLVPFSVGSNAGGGTGVLLAAWSYRDGRPCRLTEKVYRFTTRSVGGRPRDTRQETARYLELRAAGLVA